MLLALHPVEVAADPVAFDIEVDFAPSGSFAPNPAGYTILHRSGAQSFTQVRVMTTNEGTRIRIDCNANSEILIDPADMRYTRPSLPCDDRGMFFISTMSDYAQELWNKESGIALAGYAPIIKRALVSIEGLSDITVDLPDGAIAGNVLQSEIRNALVAGQFSTAADTATFLAEALSESNQTELAQAFAALAIDARLRAQGVDPISEGLMVGTRNAFALTSDIGELVDEKTIELASRFALEFEQLNKIAHGGLSENIIDTATEAGSFSTLIAAVEAAGLVDTLSGEGPFTIFAPTDEAFAALPKGTVESLLMPENRDQLIAILTYHVVPGRLMSGDLSDEMTASTVNGADITIDLEGGVMIDDAAIVTADIETSNGVIHAIDRVILPDG